MKGRIAIGLFVLALAACGGDEQGPAAAHGVLHGGTIRGVAYQTPTQSGATDAKGGFTYLPGETVTFSVGGVQLGDAPGTADISLFTLAGLTPPSTERTLRRELDLARRTHTPFTRASNIDRLLIGLDADGNPDNGLDVGAKAAVLAGITLDFDVDVFAFEDQLYRRVPDIVRGLQPWRAVTHLYKSIGLAVPVHAQVRLDSSTSLGLPGAKFLMRYHPNGALAAEESDYNGDGSTDSRYSYEYDAQLRLTRFTGEVDGDFDGISDRMSTDVRAYQANGDQLTASSSIDADGDGDWDDRYFQTSEVDRFGRTLRYTTDHDANGDGVIDARETGIGTWDSAGQPIEQSWSSDADLDGIIDDASRSIWQYDQGRLVGRVTERDLLADGVVDSRDTETFEYDGAGQLSKLAYDSDYDANGVVDDRTVYTWTYDRAGNQLTRGYETASQRVSDRLTYDAARHELTREHIEDVGGDGTAEAIQHDTRVYDGIGNQLSSVSESDTNGDGAVDVIVHEGSEFGAGGELLASAFAADWNADGLSDTHTSTGVTNEVIPDGVLHLAQWYYMRR